MTTPSFASPLPPEKWKASILNSVPGCSDMNAPSAKRSCARPVRVMTVSPTSTSAPFFRGRLRPSVPVAETSPNANSTRAAVAPKTTPGTQNTIASATSCARIA